MPVIGLINEIKNEKKNSFASYLLGNIRTHAILFY